MELKTKELDYALLINKKNKVFIEAKRPSVDLKKKTTRSKFSIILLERILI